jgi:hypothetical protein
MNSKMKRDEKDPLPGSKNSMRIPPDGNSPVTGEDHNQGKAERITGSQRYTLRSGGERQPTRQGGDGNVPVSGEDHNQGKAERITAAQRGGQNTAGDTTNSPGR